MAAKYNEYATEMEDDRLSDISAATTCFGGSTNNPHLNMLREMRKAINARRRELIVGYKALLAAAPDSEFFENKSPDCDHSRATMGLMITQYISAARTKVAEGLVNELTLNMIADSVEVMRKTWQKTKYFGKMQPNFVFKTRKEIVAPVEMPASDHPATPPTRISSPKEGALPMLPKDGFFCPEGATQ